MKRLFRPRNLLILFGLGVVIGIVVSKKNAAPAPTYPDPWATPEPQTEATTDSDAAASNGASATSEPAGQGSAS